jgi:hypothetical protein
MKMEIKSKQINLKNDLIVLPYIEIIFLTKDITILVCLVWFYNNLIIFA